MSIWKGNLWLANPIIGIQKAFHNIRYLRTASDPYQSDVGHYIWPTWHYWYQSDIEVAYLTWHCPSKNKISIRHRMIDVVLAPEFHRPDSRTASDRYQSFIQMVYLIRLYQCRNHISAVELSASFWQKNSNVFILLPYQLLYRPNIALPI